MSALTADSPLRRASTYLHIAVFDAETSRNHPPRGPVASFGHAKKLSDLAQLQLVASHTLYITKLTQKCAGENWADAEFSPEGTLHNRNFAGQTIDPLSIGHLDSRGLNPGRGGEGRAILIAHLAPA
jgi:hypothetical protein